MIIPSFVSERRNWIQARRCPCRCKSRNQPGQHRNDHAADDEAERKLNWKRRKRFTNSETKKKGDSQADKSAKETQRRRFNEELQQNRPPARTECFARPNFLGALLYAYERDVHDPNRAYE